jgi:putative peptide zinc metalloprotease protein
MIQLRPTFSESWYRVQGLKMKLRSSAQISRQFYRGERWYVVRDPAGNQFHRLSDPAYRFVALLDGTRTCEQAWELCGGQLADDAPTQPEVIQILSHLNCANLNYSDITPDSTILLRRHKKQSKKKMQNRLMNMLFPRIPMWDPNRFLKTWMPLCRVLFSRVGAVIWLIVVGLALALVLPTWDKSGHSLKVAAEHSIDVRNNPVNLILLYSVFIGIKLIHELGHAFACRRFGGECHELGVMFLVFIPTPYVDASTAWAFPNKWHRIFVGAAGMIVELFVASIAGFIWYFTGDINSVIAQLAFNAMLIASVTTLVFNANPLLRYDGYYILSDFLEIPNLRQKSSEYSLGLIKRHIFRIKSPQPLPPPLQRFWLFTYSIASSIYRMFVGLVILLIVAYELPVIGPLMAISGVATWFLVPVFMVVKYLATNGELQRKRGRAVAFCLAVAAAVFLVIGVLKFNVNIDAEGVLSVPPANARLIHIEQPGFVSQIGKSDTGATLKDGDFVHKGQIIAVLENRPLIAHLKSTEAQVRQLEVEMMAATPVSPNEHKLKEMELMELQKQLDVLNEEVAKLTIKAPIDGQLIRPDLGRMIGEYVAPSQHEFCRIIDDRQQYVEAALPQEDYQLLDRQSSWLPGHTEYRMVSNIAHCGKVLSVELVPAQFEPISPALTPLGGGTSALDTTDRNMNKLSVPEFRARVVLDDKGELVTGQRAYLRFHLPKRTLLWQWARRAWQIVETKGATAKWL